MSKTDKTLNKCNELIDRLNDLKKALNDVTHVASNRKPAEGLGVGWSQDPGTGAFHHSMHGVISTMKHPDGHYNIVHSGKLVGVAADIGEAGVKIKRHVDSLEKSNYGPKGAGAYDAAANAKRKARNVGSQVGEGPNTNAKAYSTKPGQLSAKQQAAKTPFKGAAGPVKQYSPAQIAAINEARKLKKTAEDAPWMHHAEIPNADEEVQKLQDTNPAIPGEDAMSTQLANMMLGKAMLNPNHRQPSSEDMIMAGERMGLGANPELIKAADEQWANTHNNWLAEAQKPISARFSSEEEEMAYWDSIKVNGSSKDDYGF